MTRPRKQTVDYFPHYVRHGRTMTVMQDVFGNDGYAFWFKLLEILGDTEGHFFDCNDKTNWHFLAARSLCDHEKVNEMLDLLAKLGAIDDELWQQKIIWSQNFVDNLSDLYSRRKIEFPQKPVPGMINPNEQMDEFIKKQKQCRKITQAAIDKGLMQKGNCEICDTDYDIAIHHIDYDDPFKISCLCREHHSEWHYREKIARSEGLMLTEIHFREFVEDRKRQRRGEESKGEKRRGLKTLSTDEPPTTPPLEPEVVDGNGFDLQGLATLWNQMAPRELPRVNTPFTRPPAKLKPITAALKRHPELLYWQSVFRQLPSRPFMLGRNDRRWVATFDFVVSRAEEIMDGKYSDAAGGGRHPPEPRGYQGIREFLTGGE